MLYTPLTNAGLRRLPPSRSRAKQLAAAKLKADAAAAADASAQLLATI